MKRVKLVGGSQDGKFFTVRENQYVLHFAKPKQIQDYVVGSIAAPTMQEIETYREMTVRGQKHTYGFFVVEGMTIDDALESLIGNYGEVV